MGMGPKVGMGESPLPPARRLRTWSWTAARKGQGPGQGKGQGHGPGQGQAQGTGGSLGAPVGPLSTHDFPFTSGTACDSCLVKKITKCFVLCAFAKSVLLMFQ